MGNLSHIPEEELEKLPKMERLETNYRSRHKAPWRRMNSWIASKVGKHFDSVFSDFKNLPWIQNEYKTLETFNTLLEVNTFEENGEVFFYPSHPWSFGEGHRPQPIHELGRCFGKPLYVHPKTKTIAIAPKKPKPQVPYEITEIRLRNNSELKKIGGIWYKITTSQLNSKELKNYNLKNDHVDNGISRREWLNIR